MPANFEQAFSLNRPNRLVGSGGEVVVKGVSNANTPPMRLDVGDRLIGIGVTHLVEDLGRPPGLDTFVAMNAANPVAVKSALRAFEVATKTESSNGFDFTFKPLSSQDYSDTLAFVSQGKVIIPAESIPRERSS
ncbi:MAG TPA: hypothetical protein VHI13_02430 [Candidatus Kapabacteria bacterium]|nr:hypothetical protein [Candidatus Kapabacteria bacterium]